MSRLIAPTRCGVSRLSLILAVTLGPLAPGAHAGNPAQSEALKAQADKAFSEGDYLRALRHLEAAYAADPQPALRANMGLVYKELGEYEEAVKAFKAFLTSGPEPAKAQMAQQIIARLEPEVRVTSTPPGAAIFVDGGAKPVGRTPATLRLVAGAHALQLKLRGVGEASHRLQVRPGQAASVALTLAPPKRKAPARRPPPPAAVAEAPIMPTIPMAPPSRGKRIAGWSLVAVGGLAAGGAVAAQVLGRAAADDRDSARTGAAWDDAHGQVDTWNLVFWGSAGLAGAALITGVTLLMLDGGSAPSGVQVGVSPTGASLGFEW